MAVVSAVVVVLQAGAAVVAILLSTVGLTTRSERARRLVLAGAVGANALLLTLSAVLLTGL